MDTLGRLKEQRRRIDERIKKQQRDLLYKRDARLVAIVRRIVPRTIDLDTISDDEIMLAILAVICQRADRAKIIDILRSARFVSSRPSATTAGQNESNYGDRESADN